LKSAHFCGILQRRRISEMAKSNIGKITVLLPNEEFRRFADYCREHGFKKSTLIAKLVRDFLNAEKEREKEKLGSSEQTARKV